MPPPDYPVPPAALAPSLTARARTTMQERILWALTGTLLPPDRFAPETITRAGLFLLRQKARLPDFLRPPTGLATVVFGLGSVVLYGRPFFALDFEKRRAYVARWSDSPLPPLRDYIRLVQSLVTLSAHES